MKKAAVSKMETATEQQEDCIVITVKFKKLHPDAKPFAYSRDGDACMDMYALEEVYLSSGRTALVKTGIAVELPEGHEGIVRGRSGLALKGVYVHVGTVDETYRGDVGVILMNTAFEMLHIEKGDRIAQFTVKPVCKIELEETETLSDSVRGGNGFGSSGR